MFAIVCSCFWCIRDFLKRIVPQMIVPLFSKKRRGGEEGKQVMKLEPGAGRIMYDNGCNLIQPVLARFTNFVKAAAPGWSFALPKPRSCRHLAFLLVSP